MGTVQLRDADWRDLARMATLESEIFPDDAWSEATMWAELALRPRRAYLVAEGADANHPGGPAGLDGLDGSDGSDGLDGSEGPDGPGGSDGTGVPAGPDDPAREGLLGYAGLDLSGDVADVMTVAVDPRARGRGVGAMLLTGLHSLARGAGARSMMLEVRADNDSALGLYRTRGYEVVRTRRGYYRDPSGGPARDALIMRKELHEDG